MRRGRWFAVGLAAALAMAGVFAGGAAASTEHAGGITYVAKDLPTQQGGTKKRFHVNCPSGTHVLGGGAFASLTFGGGSIQHSYPIDRKDADKKPDDGWEVALFTGQPNVDWTLYADCTKRRLTYVTEPFKARPNQLTNQLVTCPGKQNLVGGGEKGSFKISQNSAFPSGNSWINYEDSFESSKIPAKGYAICAGFETSINQGMTDVPKGQDSGMGVGCPIDEFLAAGGTSNSSAHAGASIQFSYPDHAADWASATNNFSGGTMTVKVYAICVAHL